MEKYIALLKGLKFKHQHRYSESVALAPAYVFTLAIDSIDVTFVFNDTAVNIVYKGMITGLPLWSVQDITAQGNMLTVHCNEFGNRYYQL